MAAVTAVDVGIAEDDDLKKYFENTHTYIYIYIYTVLDLTSIDLQLNEMGCLNHHLPCGKTKIH